MRVTFANNKQGINNKYIIVQSLNKRDSTLEEH